LKGAPNEGQRPSLADSRLATLVLALPEAPAASFRLGAAELVTALPELRRRPSAAPAEVLQAMKDRAPHLRDLLVAYCPNCQRVVTPGLASVVLTAILEGTRPSCSECFVGNAFRAPLALGI
jgi:hypothetical protein